MALLSEKADIQYTAERTSPDKIVAEIQNLGFGAELISESELYQEGQIDLSVSERQHRQRVWVEPVLASLCSTALFST